MRNVLINLAAIIAVVCAIIATGLTVRRELISSQNPAEPTAPQTIEDWKDYAGAGHVLGPSSAPLTIVEFADFECPFCRTLKVAMDSVQRMYPGDIRLVFRHFPLPAHPHAVSAARTAECAGDQGRFAAMYDMLYMHQDSFGLVPWSWFGKAAEIPDLKRFDDCISDSRRLLALERDTIAARRLNVRATPTMLINGWRVEGAVPFDSLAAYLVRVKNGVAASAGRQN